MCTQIYTEISFFRSNSIEKQNYDFDAQGAVMQWFIYHFVIFHFGTDFGATSYGTNARTKCIRWRRFDQWFINTIPNEFTECKSKPPHYTIATGDRNSCKLVRYGLHAASKNSSRSRKNWVLQLQKKHQICMNKIPQLVGTNDSFAYIFVHPHSRISVRFETLWLPNAPNEPF